MSKTKVLSDQLTTLEEQYRILVREYNKKCEELYSARAAVKKSVKKREFAGDISFDFWPLSDWTRLTKSGWKPGNYFQLCIGPIRIEFYEF